MEINKLLEKKLKEAKATGSDIDSQPDLSSEIWEPGYPQLRALGVVKEVPEGSTSLIIPVPGKLTPGTSFGTSDVTFVGMTYNTITLGNPVGVNLGWTREYIEDAPWDAVAPQLKEAGRALEQKLFEDILSTIDNAGVSNTFTLSGTITWANFVEGISKLAEDDYECDIVICHPSEYAELLQLDQFVNAAYMGSSEPISSGVLRTTLGVTIVSSSVCTDGKMYFIDSDKALAVAQRRDKKAEEYSYPDQNLYGVVVSSRYGIKVILEKAIAIGTK